MPTLPSLCERLLPAVAADDDRGHRAALVAFALLVALMLLRSLVRQLKDDSGVPEAR